MTHNTLGIVHDASELRKLIADNPDLPIVFLAGTDANIDGNRWMYCTSVDCSIEEILDIETPYGDDKVFDDRADLEEEISDALWTPVTDKLSNEEYDALVQKELAKYEPYWRKVIAVYVNN